MADLRKFIYSGLRSGTPILLYVYPNKITPVGDGVVGYIESLRMAVKAKGYIIKPFDASVRIIMPDLAPSGVCRLKIADNPEVESKYWEEDGRLNIDAYHIQIYTEGKWTWVRIQDFYWVGIWPEGEAMTETDKAMLSLRSPDAPVSYDA